MSEALYDVNGLPIGGVRFWTPEEMERRDWIKRSLVSTIQQTLLDLNQMWRMLEVETPLMMPMATPGWSPLLSPILLFFVNRGVIMPIVLGAFFGYLFD